MVRFDAATISTTWERWRLAGPLRCDGHPQPADETSALPGPAIRFARESRGRSTFLQSARGLAQSKTLRGFQESSYHAQRLGVRWPSTAFPGGISNGADDCQKDLTEIAT